MDDQQQQARRVLLERDFQPFRRLAEAFVGRSVGIADDRGGLLFRPTCCERCLLKPVPSSLRECLAADDGGARDPAATVPGLSESAAHPAGEGRRRISAVTGPAPLGYWLPSEDWMSEAAWHQTCASRMHLVGAQIVSEGLVFGCLVADVDRTEGAGGDDDGEDARLGGLLRDLAGVAAADCFGEMEAADLTRELTDRYEELHLIYELGSQIDAREDPDRAVRGIVGLAMTALNAVGASFVPANGSRPVVCTPPDLPESGRARLRGDIERVCLDHAREALAQQKAVVIEDLHPDTARSDDPHALQSVLSVPLVFKGDQYGSICLVRDGRTPPFDSGGMMMMTTLARHAAIVIRNSHLFADLRGLFDGLIEALVSAIDAKDRYTSGHSLRVKELSLLLASEVDLSPRQQQGLKWAALLHDIGKIGVPEHVLNKTDALTDEDWRVIKRHPVISHRVLASIKPLAEALPGVLHHHEHYDGSGYPNGLRGREIPLIARIITVADVFDALTSDRAYRDRFTYERALSVLQQERGRLIDPGLAAPFARVVAGLEGRSRWADRPLVASSAALQGAE